MINRGVIYLSGVRTAETDAVANRYGNMLPLGLIVQPLTKQYFDDARMYSWFGIDNGCFMRPDRFNLAKYLGMIRRAYDEHGDRIMFATAPDVFNIAKGEGDWQATIEKSRPILPMIRDIGVPAAIVLQEGATLENMPWNEFDVLFIGGGDAFKLGRLCRSICHEAVRRGKQVHMGRVNSLKRMRIAYDFGCFSADGTFLMHQFKKNGCMDTCVDQMLGWLRGVWADEVAKLSPAELAYQQAYGWADGCEV